MRTASSLATLFACCLWGALAGWAVALAVAQPEPPPGATLLAYGAIALYGAGYLLGAAVLVAAAVFGVLCGLARTRPAASPRGRSRR